jgi:HK97 family phage major capsid protein
MPKINDPAKLAELQNKRLELYNKATEYHSANEKEWNTEHEAAWNAMQTDYETVYAQLEDHQKCVAAEVNSAEAAQARAEKLAQMAGHGQRFNNRQQNLLLSGGGSNLNDDDDDDDFERPARGQNKITTGPCAGLTRDEVGNMAFSAWLRPEGPKNKREVSAMQIVGINSGRAACNFNFLDTREGRKIQQAVRNRSIDDQFMNALSSNVGSGGGYLFGSTFITALEVAMVSASGILEVADIIRTDNGEEMSWPTADDTDNEGEQIGESVEVDEEDPAFGLTRWYAHKFTSKMIKVPRELIEDNGVSLENRIPEMLGERIGRIINRKATTGNGASTMYGIVNASTTGKVAASKTAITFDEVIDLEHSLGRHFRNNPRSLSYMLNDTTLKLLRKLKDGQQRYLWQAGANTGVPDTLNTYRYVINDHMEDPFDARKTILFGKLSNYKLRLVRNIRVARLNERYAEKDQVAFVAFIRGDGNLLDAGDNPVMALAQAP